MSTPDGMVTVWAPSGEGVHIHKAEGVSVVVDVPLHVHDGLAPHEHGPDGAAVNQAPGWGAPPERWLAEPGWEFEFEVAHDVDAPGAPVGIVYRDDVVAGLREIAERIGLTHPGRQVVITYVRKTRDRPADPPPTPEAGDPAPVQVITYPPLTPGEAELLRTATVEEVDLLDGGRPATLHVLPQDLRYPQVCGLIARGLVEALGDPEEPRYYLTARGVGAHYRLGPAPEGPAPDPQP